MVKKKKNEEEQQPVDKDPEESRDEFLVAVGERIRALRSSHGWTQRTLGDRCGMAATAIYLIEKGAQNSSLTTLKKVTSALGVSMATVLPEAERGVEMSFRLSENLRNRSEELLETLRSRRKSVDGSFEEIEKKVLVYLELMKDLETQK
ncbi:helix-turn-helix domain-containing protein [Methylosinus sp. Sm6]|jgi:transcriptional regulator with XRE-family HTH domain|uniref:helix-turn-helix domain-containing protein n=1 Tax=Methylosinus sp. Sm6 TaxID=2866948 RepID=UPI001C99007D|nr:helix-turn-helix domain-containing protein [Methylosinus sp. Sm6]MBY6240393.1 helix-turn-helix domain-containing protein [Methylosinus sp. Sm6]